MNPVSFLPNPSLNYATISSYAKKFKEGSPKDWKKEKDQELLIRLLFELFSFRDSPSIHLFIKSKDEKLAQQFQKIFSIYYKIYKINKEEKIIENKIKKIEDKINWVKFSIYNTNNTQREIKQKALDYVYEKTEGFQCPKENAGWTYQLFRFVKKATQGQSPHFEFKVIDLIFKKSAFYIKGKGEIDSCNWGFALLSWRDEVGGNKVNSAANSIIQLHPLEIFFDKLEKPKLPSLPIKYNYQNCYFSEYIVIKTFHIFIQYLLPNRKLVHEDLKAIEGLTQKIGNPTRCQNLYRFIKEEERIYSLRAIVGYLHSNNKFLTHIQPTGKLQLYDAFVFIYWNIHKRKIESVPMRCDLIEWALFSKSYHLKVAAKPFPWKKIRHYLYSLKELYGIEGNGELFEHYALKLLMELDRFNSKNFNKLKDWIDVIFKLNKSPYISATTENILWFIEKVPYKELKSIEKKLTQTLSFFKQFPIRLKPASSLLLKYLAERKDLAQDLKVFFANLGRHHEKKNQEREVNLDNVLNLLGVYLKEPHSDEFTCIKEFEKRQPKSCLDLFEKIETLHKLTERESIQVDRGRLMIIDQFDRLPVEKKREREDFEHFCKLISCRPIGGLINDEDFQYPGLNQAVLHRFEIIKKVAEGGFSSVFLVKERKSEFLCALKLIPGPKGELSDGFLISKKEPKGEVLATSELTAHPHLIETIGFIIESREEKEYLYCKTIDLARCDGGRVIGVVSQYIPSLDIHTLLGESGKLSMKKAVPILLHVAKAIAAFHVAGIVHRDVTLRNVLLDKLLNGYLMDYNTLRKLDKDKKFCLNSVEGVAPYLPLEALKQGNMCDEKVDIYAFAVVMYRMVFGKFPLQFKLRGQYIEYFKNKENKRFKEPAHMDQWEGELYQLIVECSDFRNPRARLDIKTIIRRLFRIATKGGFI